MIELLQNKNSATRFQIMVEIAVAGPRVSQRGIAASLGITPQAVSDYLRQMAGEGLVEGAGRSSLKLSASGVNWVLKMLRELNDYTARAAQAVTNITVCAAVADSDLRRGQAVGLKMKGGLLVATAKPGRGARGIAAGKARCGEAVGISGIEGLVELKRGKITVLEVPAIQQGGPPRVDIKKLQARLTGGRSIGAIGIEALAALRQAGVEPRYLFGVAEAAVEEARCGLSSVIVCTSDAIPGLIKKLQESGLDYELVSLG